MPGTAGAVQGGAAGVGSSRDCTCANSCCVGRCVQVGIVGLPNVGKVRQAVEGASAGGEPNNSIAADSKWGSAIFCWAGGPRCKLMPAHWAPLLLFSSLQSTLFNVLTKMGIPAESE